MVANAPGDPLIIVGNGMVSWHFCRRLVELGLHERFAIEVFGEEPVPAYDRIRLGELVAPGGDESQLQLSPTEWYAEHGIRLTCGRPVLSIDPKNNRVRTNVGDRNYAKLVLATGSEARRLDCPGHDLPCVATYRRIEDATRISEQVRAGTRVVMVGGGLLGIELAHALTQRGADVTILERSPGILIRQLNVVASTLLRRRIESLGIAIETEVRVAAIHAKDDAAVVQREDGQCHDADLVIATIGIRARDDLSRAAGLTCSPSGGVIIDHCLRTSSANIFAIGECASFAATVYGLAAPGFHMADVLAERLAGQHDRLFTGYDLGTRLKLVGVDVATMGEFHGDGETYGWRDDQEYRQLVVKEGRLVGATVIGSWSALPRIADAIARREAVDRKHIRTFERGGIPVADGGVAEWPPEAVVCACRQVTRARIGEAILAGATDIQAIGTSTSAGTVCGSCRPLLADMLGLDPRLVATLRFAWPLALLAGAALVLVSIAATWSIPRAQSWTELGGLESLWRNPLLLQISGFTMVGLAGISCVLSLRKRIRRFTWGDIGWWRLAHVALAWMAGAALVVHNGFRLGHNLNRWLVLTWLSLLGVGALATFALIAERKIPFLAAGGRAWIVRIHIGLVWLLIPLVIFHVVEVYRW